MENDSPAPPQTIPRLIGSDEVRTKLRLQRDELKNLLEIGILTPVARSPQTLPLFDHDAIDRLATKQERERLRDAVSWDFEPTRAREALGGRPWIKPVDLPFYPFDNEAQQAWARRLHKMKKSYGPFLHFCAPQIERHMRKVEEKATRAFERAHGIKRKRKPRATDIYIRRRPIHMTRAQILKLVWSKPMIPAAAGLKTSEFTLRSICKRFNIPTPPRGHFNHNDPKNRTPRPALPPMVKKP